MLDLCQEELRTSLETTCGLVFDDETMQELFDLLDRATPLGIKSGGYSWYH